METIQIFGKIKGAKYHKLLDYLFIKSNIITFHIQNNFQTYINEKNIKFFSIPNFKDYKNKEDCEEFIKHKRKVEKYITPFRRFFIKEFEDVEYAGGLYVNKMEIKVIKFDEALLKVLKNTEGLYDWKYPNMPEDLCFYNEDKCILRSVAHENLCFIFADDDEIIHKIKEIGFDFVVFPRKEEDVPRIILKL